MVPRAVANTISRQTSRSTWRNNRILGLHLTETPWAILVKALERVAVRDVNGKGIVNLVGGVL